MKEAYLVYFPKWDILVIAKETKQPFWYKLENSEMIRLKSMPLFFTKAKFPNQVIILDSWIEDANGISPHFYNMNCECLNCRKEYSEDWK